MSSEKNFRTTSIAGAQDLLANERLIRDAEGAEMLGCSKATFWRLVAKGAILPPIKIGGMSRWKVSDVQKLIEQASQVRNK
jgi:predicted DNA-binding transcriptional regulator AlpA|tara:strand:+ start:2426 stop:2668 length:243 start_codon:yes stop_codon:yes gene_type:complete